MRLKGINVGVALTGSHCTLDQVLPQIEKIIAEGGLVSAIISPSVDHTDTRFGESSAWKQRLVQITGNRLINSIPGAEPVGPKKLFDVLVVAPCSGNTLAKLASGITDTAVLMAAKAQLDTRFGESSAWKQRLVQITGNRLINSISGAEPVGPKKLFDVLVVAPCSGNTLAKLASGITDTAVLMAAKAQLRNQRPVILGISTNDGLGLNARNIGTLLITKNLYMVPYRQDNPYSKPNSLVAEMDLMIPVIEAALQGKQFQPLLLGPKSEEFTIV